MKFRVGDTVRRLRNPSRMMPPGVVGVVAFVDMDGWISLPGFGATLFNPDNFELVRRAPEARGPGAGDELSEIEKLRFDVLRMARSEAVARGWCDEIEEILKKIPGLIPKPKKREIILRFDQSEQFGFDFSAFLADKNATWFRNHIISDLEVEVDE